MLLVDDHQPELVERDVVLQQRVRADEMNAAARQAGDDAAALGGGRCR